MANEIKKELIQKAKVELNEEELNAVAGGNGDSSCKCEATGTSDTTPSIQFLFL